MERTKICTGPRVTPIIVAFLVTFILGNLAATSLFGQPRFPVLTGRVVDEARLLSAQEIQLLTELLRDLEDKTTDQVVVYTTKSLQGYPIEDYGYQLLRTWGIGQKDKNNGVLLIVAPHERRVRIEVGYGLEPYLTDATCKLIIENSILPAFRRGDFPEGVKAGVADIRAVLLGNREAIKQPSSRPVEFSRKIEESAPYVILFMILLLGFFPIITNIFYRPRRGSISSWSNSGSDGGSSYGGWGGWGGGGGGGGFSGSGGSGGGGGGSGSW